MKTRRKQQKRSWRRDDEMRKKRREEKSSEAMRGTGRLTNVCAIQVRYGRGQRRLAD